MIGTFDFKCRDCGKTFELIIFDNAESRDSLVCPVCMSSNIDKQFTPPCRKGRAALLGQYSDDINSDNYYRPDNPIESRRLEYVAHRIEKLEQEGKLPHVDDFKDMRQAIDMHKYCEAKGIKFG